MQKGISFLFVLLMVTAFVVHAGIGTDESESVFLTSLPPNAPVLCTPLTGQTDVQVPMALCWHKLLHASAYRIQVSTLSDFSTLAVNFSDLADTVFSVQELTRSTRYYWRVNGINVAGAGLFSSLRDFTTVIAAPGVPILVAPINGATGVAVDAELHWNAVASATSYVIQVSSLPDFSSLVFEKKDETGTLCPVTGLAGNTLYFWRIYAVNAGGTGPFSPVYMFTTGGTSIADKENDALPECYTLLPAYPNPFNAGTTITWELPENAPVNVCIYNCMGQRIRKVTTGIHTAGSHSTLWDGCDDLGQSVTSGMYLCRFESGKRVFIQKLLILR